MAQPISERDLIDSVADALQYISTYHPPDFIAHLARSHEREESPAAKAAIGQILINSRMAAIGRRPICQDTGTVVVFAKVGMRARIDSDRPLAALIDEGVRKAYLDPDNPLRASMVADTLFERRNTRDNTPAVLHVEMVEGATLKLHVAAKGAGSENKARFAVLRPADSLVDWVLKTVEGLGAGWCPPGIIGIGAGGSAEKAMAMAKESLLQPIDMTDLMARGPSSKVEALRIELYEKINALGIGAQGLGGLTTVVDVKIATCPSHAASLPVGLIPQCASDRHIAFELDGTGAASFEPPPLELWPELALDGVGAGARRVDLDRLTREAVAGWRAGETLLLSGRLLTGRDAAHRRLAEMTARGEPMPVSFKDRVIYYVGPVSAVRDEAVGPAGPTTASRMDPYTEMMLDAGLIGMVGKAERGPETVAAIKRRGAAYLIAVGGAAYLVSKAIKSARVVAFEDLGMEAIHEFVVEDMPVTVAVDSGGRSVHRDGPLQWRRTPIQVG
jgi:fumarate hydratase class I